MDPWTAYRDHHRKRLERALESGEVDPPIVPLLNMINVVPDLITTSSCSGRVILLATSPDETKKDSSFFRKWHRPVGVEEVIDAVNEFEGDVLWLKVDPFIVHIAAKDFELAIKIVKAARSAGAKISGIQEIKEWRSHIEIRGIDNMSVPLFWKGGRIIGDEALTRIIPIVNRKIVKNQVRLERLYETLYNLFNNLYPEIFRGVYL